MSTLKMLSAITMIVALSLAGPAAVRAAGIDKPQVGTNSALGSYLTDGRGMTLYYFKKDAQDRNACTGGCLEKWPVYYAEKVVAPAGSVPSDFGTFVRSDGTRQTTFKGWPLYYFAGDKAPGDTKGQGVKDVWYVINPGTLEPGH